MAEHVVIRKLEHLTGSATAPRLSYAVETRESPGPAHKHGAFPEDIVWIKLHGGLVVGKAKVRICWVGEYSNIAEIRARTSGSPLFDVSTFWAGRPKAGYAAVAELAYERWLDPFWAGPRSYGYEWVILDSDRKKATWHEKKEPPRSGEALIEDLKRWMAAR